MRKGLVVVGLVFLFGLCELASGANQSIIYLLTSGGSVKHWEASASWSDPLRPGDTVTFTFRPEYYNLIGKTVKAVLEVTTPDGQVANKTSSTYVTLMNQQVTLSMRVQVPNVTGRLPFKVRVRYVVGSETKQADWQTIYFTVSVQNQLNLEIIDVVDDSSDDPVYGAVVSVAGQTKVYFGNSLLFTDLEPKTWKITTTATGYLKDEEWVTLEPSGTTSTRITLKKKSTGPQLQDLEIVNVIDDANGAPVYGAVVSVAGQTKTYNGTSLLFRDLEPASWVVTTSAAGYETNQEGVTLNLDGSTTKMQITLTKLVTGPQPPSCSVSASPNSGYAPLKVEFYTTSGDSDGQVVGREFDYGEGDGWIGMSSLDELRWSIRYTRAGTYHVYYRVTDEQGLTAMATTQVVVAPPAQSVPYVILTDGSIAGYLVSNQSESIALEMENVSGLVTFTLDKQDRNDDICIELVDAIGRVIKSGCSQITYQSTPISGWALRITAGNVSNGNFVLRRTVSSSNSGVPYVFVQAGKIGWGFISGNCADGDYLCGGADLIIGFIPIVEDVQDLSQMVFNGAMAGTMLVAYPDTPENQAAIKAYLTGAAFGGLGVAASFAGGFVVDPNQIRNLAKYGDDIPEIVRSLKLSKISGKVDTLPEDMRKLLEDGRVLKVNDQSAIAVERLIPAFSEAKRLEGIGEHANDVGEEFSTATTEAFLVGDGHIVDQQRFADLVGQTLTVKQKTVKVYADLDTVKYTFKKGPNTQDATDVDLPSFKDGRLHINQVVYGKEDFHNERQISQIMLAMKNDGIDKKVEAVHYLGWDNFKSVAIGVQAYKPKAQVIIPITPTPVEDDVINIVVYNDIAIPTDMPTVSPTSVPIFTPTHTPTPTRTPTFTRMPSPTRTIPATRTPTPTRTPTATPLPPIVFEFTVEPTVVPSGDDVMFVVSSQDPRWVEGDYYYRFRVGTQTLTGHSASVTVSSLLLAGGQHDVTVTIRKTSVAGPIVGEIVSTFEVLAAPTSTVTQTPLPISTLTATPTSTPTRTPTLRPTSTSLSTATSSPRPTVVSPTPTRAVVTASPTNTSAPVSPTPTLFLTKTPTATPTEEVLKIVLAIEPSVVSVMGEVILSVFSPDPNWDPGKYHYSFRVANRTSSGTRASATFSNLQYFPGTYVASVTIRLGSVSGAVVAQIDSTVEVVSATQPTPTSAPSQTPTLAPTLSIPTPTRTATLVPTATLSPTVLAATSTPASGGMVLTADPTSVEAGGEVRLTVSSTDPSWNRFAYYYDFRLASHMTTGGKWSVTLDRLWMSPGPHRASVTVRQGTMYGAIVAELETEVTIFNSPAKANTSASLIVSPNLIGDSTNFIRFDWPVDLDWFPTYQQAEFRISGCDMVVTGVMPYGAVELNLPTGTHQVTARLLNSNLETLDEAIASISVVADLPSPTPFVTPTGLPVTSDLNKDGVTDDLDLRLLLGCWHTNDPAGDCDHDGQVDWHDLLYLQESWQR